MSVIRITGLTVVADGVVAGGTVQCGKSLWDSPRQLQLSNFSVRYTLQSLIGDHVKLKLGTLLGLTNTLADANEVDGRVTAVVHNDCCGARDLIRVS